MSESYLEVISTDRRDDILNRVVAIYAQEGWTISAVYAGQAIAQRRVPLGGYKTWINIIYWVVAILATILSGGLFLLVLLALYLGRATETVIINVDEHGTISTR